MLLPVFKMEANRIASRGRCYLCGRQRSAVVALFGFPASPERQRLWLRNIGHPKLTPEQCGNLDNIKLCAAHFAGWCFTSTEKKRLIRYAVPNYEEPPCKVPGFKESYSADVDIPVSDHSYAACGVTIGNNCENNDCEVNVVNKVTRVPVEEPFGDSNKENSYQVRNCKEPESVLREIKKVTPEKVNFEVAEHDVTHRSHSYEPAHVEINPHANAQGSSQESPRLAVWQETLSVTASSGNTCTDAASEQTTESVEVKQELCEPSEENSGVSSVISECSSSPEFLNKNRECQPVLCDIPIAEFQLPPMQELQHKSVQTDVSLSLGWERDCTQELKLQVLNRVIESYERKLEKLVDVTLCYQKNLRSLSVKYKKEVEKNECLRAVIDALRYEGLIRDSDIEDSLNSDSETSYQEKLQQEENNSEFSGLEFLRDDLLGHMEERLTCHKREGEVLYHHLKVTDNHPKTCETSNHVEKEKCHNRKRKSVSEDVEEICYNRTALLSGSHQIKVCKLWNCDPERSVTHQPAIIP